MRHIVFRFVLALVWLVAMVVCIIEKNMSSAPIYGIVFICLVASGVQLMKKRKANGGNK